MPVLSQSIRGQVAEYIADIVTMFQLSGLVLNQLG